MFFSVRFIHVLAPVSSWIRFIFTVGFGFSFVFGMPSRIKALLNLVSSCFALPTRGQYRVHASPPGRNGSLASELEGFMISDQDEGGELRI